MLCGKHYEIQPSACVYVHDFFTVHVSSTRQHHKFQRAYATPYRNSIKRLDSSAIKQASHPTANSTSDSSTSPSISSPSHSVKCFSASSSRCVGRCDTYPRAAERSVSTTRPCYCVSWNPTSARSQWRISRWYNANVEISSVRGLRIRPPMLSRNAQWAPGEVRLEGRLVVRQAVRQLGSLGC